MLKQINRRDEGKRVTTDELGEKKKKKNVNSQTFKWNWPEYEWLQLYVDRVQNFGSTSFLQLSTMCVHNPHRVG